METAGGRKIAGGRDTAGGRDIRGKGYQGEGILQGEGRQVIFWSGFRLLNSTALHDDRHVSFFFFFFNFHGACKSSCL